MEKDAFKLDNIEGIICLEGLVFIREAMFRKSDPIVKKTLGDLFKYVSNN